MIQARDMTPAELAALLAFHAEAGVEWLVEDDPVDRIAAFAEEKGRAAIVETGSGAGTGSSAGRPDQSPRPLGASAGACAAFPKLCPACHSG